METLEKVRQPMANMEAIYLISPTEESVNTLINDFKSSTSSLFKAAHVYFTAGTTVVAAVKTSNLLSLQQSLTSCSKLGQNLHLDNTDGITSLI